LEADLQDIETYHEQNTGTITDRRGYRDLMEDGEADGLDYCTICAV